MKGRKKKSLDEFQKEWIEKFAQKRMATLLRNASDLTMRQAIKMAYSQGATDMALAVVHDECSECEGKGWIDHKHSKFPSQIGSVHLPCPRCNPIKFK